jgi:hypothetical protein
MVVCGAFGCDSHLLRAPLLTLLGSVEKVVVLHLSPRVFETMPPFMAPAHWGVQYFAISWMQNHRLLLLGFTLLACPTNPNPNPLLLAKTFLDKLNTFVKELLQFMENGVFTIVYHELAIINI